MAIEWTPGSRRVAFISWGRLRLGPLGSRACEALASLLCRPGDFPALEQVLGALVRPVKVQTQHDLGLWPLLFWHLHRHPEEVIALEKALAAAVDELGEPFWPSLAPAPALAPVPVAEPNMDPFADLRGPLKAASGIYHQPPARPRAAYTVSEDDGLP